MENGQGGTTDPKQSSAVCPICKEEMSGNKLPDHIGEH